MSKKTKKPVLELEPVSIQPKDVSGSMILRNVLAEGTYGPYKFSVTTAVPSGDIIVEVGETKVSLSINSMVEKVLAQLSDLWSAQ